MTPPPRPGLLKAYGLATTALSPLAPALLRYRSGRGKEDTDRLPERYGRAARPRPTGALVWAHGASIGETLSLLPVVEALVQRGTKVLVTSGTVTSASVLARRLPSGARHQYLPLDVPRFVRRFLEHWRPDAAIFAESEIWPNAILELDRRGVPLLLVNARVSPRSAGRWRRMAPVAQALFGRVEVCVAQTEEDGVRLAELGAPVRSVSGNLKFDLPPPPADPAAVEKLDALLAGRPLWMAASTHRGEELAAFEAHRALRQRCPGLLTIVAPRHPERGADLVDDARALGVQAVRRSAGAGPDTAKDVYLVDTIGELGLFYRLCPLVFVGGSLTEHGGQNPFEAARLGRGVLHGHHVGNFAAIYAALDRGGGARAVETPAALTAAVGDLVGDAARLRDMGRASVETALSLGGALARTMTAIEPSLPRRQDPGAAFW